MRAADRTSARASTTGTPGETLRDLEKSSSVFLLRPFSRSVPRARFTRPSSAEAREPPCGAFRQSGRRSLLDDSAWTGSQRLFYDCLGRSIFGRHPSSFRIRDTASPKHRWWSALDRPESSNFRSGSVRGGLGGCIRSTNARSGLCSCGGCRRPRCRIHKRTLLIQRQRFDVVAFGSEPAGIIFDAGRGSAFARPSSMVADRNLPKR